MKEPFALLLLAAAVALLPPMGFATQKKPDHHGITLAGTTQGNVGCMILEKYMPLKRKLLLATVIYARTQYRVLQTFNYKPTRQKYTGTDQVKELNHAAVRDKIKLVVLPAHHTQAQLQDARKLCQK